MGATTVTTRPAMPAIARSTVRLGARIRARRVLPAVFGAAVGGAAWFVMHHALVDDAFITLSYARTLAFHAQWGVVAGIPANTATSPLQVLLLAGLTVVVRDAVVAAGLLTALSLACIGWSLARVGRSFGAPAAPYLAVAALATSPLLVSTIGLETYVALALLALAAAALDDRRWITCGVIAGLLVLCRPDLVVVAALLVLLCGRHGLRAAAAALAIYLPWAAFAWMHLGSLIPDTWVFKYGGSGFAQGLLVHYTHEPVAIALSLLPALAGVLAVPVWLRQPVARLWAGGAVLHVVALSALGTWIYHWYYGPAVGALTMLGCLAVARSLARGGFRWWVLAPTTLATVAVSAGFLVQHGVVRDRAPVSINWASEAQYRALAATIPTGAVVQSPGEVGTLAYFCRCAVVDGLSDRGYLPGALDRLLPTMPGPVRTALDLNYRHLDRRVPVRATWRVTSGLDAPGPAGPGFRLDGSWPNPSDPRNPTDSRRVVVEPVR
jgi:hypothetical protein